MFLDVLARGIVLLFIYREVFHRLARRLAWRPLYTQGIFKGNHQ